MSRLRQKTAKLLLVGQLLLPISYLSISHADDSLQLSQIQCKDSFKTAEPSQHVATTDFNRALERRLGSTSLLHDLFNNVEILETYELDDSRAERLYYDIAYLKNLEIMFMQTPKIDVPTELVYQHLDAGRELNYRGIYVALNRNSGNLLRARLESASNLLKKAWKICKTNDCRDRYYALTMVPMISRSWIEDWELNQGRNNLVSQNIVRMLLEEESGRDVTRFVKHYEDSREKLLFMSVDEFKTLVDDELNPAQRLSVKLLARFGQEKPLTNQDLKQVKDFISELAHISESRKLAAAISKAKRHVLLFDDFELLNHTLLKFSNFMDEFNRLHLILMSNREALHIGNEYNAPYAHLVGIFNNLSEFSAVHGAGAEEKVIGQLVLPQQQANEGVRKPLEIVRQEEKTLNVFQKLARLTRSFLSFNKQKTWDYTPAPMTSKDLREIFDERALPLENIAAHEFHLDRKDLNETHLFEEQMKLSYTELLLSTHVNLVNISIRTTSQQLADLNQRIIKNKGASESLISGAVVSNVQTDIIKQIKKIDLLNQKYSALAAKKAEFKEQLLREIVLLELKLKTAFGMSKDLEFAEETKGSAREKYSADLFKHYENDIEFLNEMKKAFMSHEATYINFNMTIAGAKLAKQSLRFLSDYCQGILSSLIAQNNSNIMGASAQALTNLKQFAIEKEAEFRDLNRQTSFELLPPKR